MQSHPITAYIALGANLGDRAANIRTALHELETEPGIRVIRVSTLIENPAVGMPEGSPNFLNGVAEIETTIDAQELLHALLSIELKLGRQRRAKWEPRMIDLDLLLYTDQVISTGSLIVPHPLLHTRRFVLEPLTEIAPGLVHPKLGITIKSLLANL